MLRRRRTRFGRRRALVAGLVAVSASWLAPPAVAATGNGLLRPTDVGLVRVSEPHESTVIAVDLVEADSCEHGGTEERAARVQSFATSADDPSSGAALNQIVYDFDSRAAAKQFFARVRANERRRAACGNTEKAEHLTYSSAPAGVGDQRFTIVADEIVAGDVRAVRAVHLLDGAHVHKLVFLDWDDSRATPSALAGRAVKRLA